MDSVVEKSYSEVLKPAFLSYAMSVITDRALPDVRDGLKPVHRRILWAMYESGNVAGKPYRKSARTVGDVIGKYHPHGDAAVYQAMVRMAQPWALAAPLIDGQGNFGSLDDDPPAAMRYTEARLSRVTTETFFGEIDSGVDFRANYDGTQKEPVVLPVAYPNLIVNGIEGIAVGMAASIPTHNLGEVVAVTKRLIETNGEASNEELLALMPGPDFPTGGIVHELDGYREAFVTGRGRVRVRATYEVERRKRGEALVFTSIPYGVSKAKILEEIAALVRDKKIEGIADLRDESNKNGVRIWLAIKSGYDPHQIAQMLFALSSLDRAITYNITVLDEGAPKEMGIRDCLTKWIAFRREVVRKRFEAELAALQKRAHLLLGIMRAIDSLDDTIALIRASKTVEEAKAGLIGLLAIDEVQANAVLDIKLHRLAAFEIEKLVEEYQSIMDRIAQIKAILADAKAIDAVIIEELDEIARRFAAERATEVSLKGLSVDAAAVVRDEHVVVILTERGYVVRIPEAAFESQRRGTKGKRHVSLNEGDRVRTLASGHATNLFYAISSNGRLYAVPAHEIPEQERHIRNVIDIDGEIVAAFLADESVVDKDLVFVTKKGIIKRSEFSLFASATRKSGVQAITLDEKDEVVASFFAVEGNEVMIVSAHGYAVRFAIDEVRSVGRTGKGVTGMRFRDASDFVIRAFAVKENAEVFVIAKDGKGKRIAASEFRGISRASKGVALFPSKKQLEIADALCIENTQDSIVVFSRNGVANRVALSDVPLLSRSSIGAYVVRPKKGDEIYRAEIVPVNSLEEEQTQQD